MSEHIEVTDMSYEISFDIEPFVEPDEVPLVLMTLKLFGHTSQVWLYPSEARALAEALLKAVTDGQIVAVANGAKHGTSE